MSKSRNKFNKLQLGHSQGVQRTTGTSEIVKFFSSQPNPSHDAQQTDRNSPLLSEQSTSSTPSGLPNLRMLQKVQNKIATRQEAVEPSNDKISKFFTCNNSMDDFETPKKVPRIAKNSKQSKEFRPKKPLNTRKVPQKKRGKQPTLNDLLTAQSSYEQIDAEQLQLALALSQSMMDPNENVSDDRLNLSHFKFDGCQSKSHDVFSIFTGGKQRNKHRRRITALTKRDPAKQSEILADKVAKLREKYFIDCPHHADDQYQYIVSSFILEDLLETDRTLFDLGVNAEPIAETLDLFYAGALVERTAVLSCGGLLRDWSTIPGRPTSPIKLDPSIIASCLPAISAKVTNNPAQLYRSGSPDIFSDDSIASDVSTSISNTYTIAGNAGTSLLLNNEVSIEISSEEIIAETVTDVITALKATVEEIIITSSNDATADASVTSVEDVNCVSTTRQNNNRLPYLNSDESHASKSSSLQSVIEILESDEEENVIDSLQKSQKSLNSLRVSMSPTSFAHNSEDYKSPSKLDTNDDCELLCSSDNEFNETIGRYSPPAMITHIDYPFPDSFRDRSYVLDKREAFESEVLDMIEGLKPSKKRIDVADRMNLTVIRRTERKDTTETIFDKYSDRTNLSPPKLSERKTVRPNLPDKFCNDVYYLRTTNVSPLPNYHRMTDDELNSELDLFGLKTLNRKQAVQILEHIYYQTHPFVSIANEVALGRSDCVSNLNQKIVQSADEDPDWLYLFEKYGSTVMRSPKKHAPTILDEDTRETASAAASYLCKFSVDLLLLPNEVVILPQKPRKRVHSCAIPLHIAFYNLLQANEYIFSNILAYEPIMLDSIHQHFKELDLCYGKNDLMDFLDKRCITFRASPKLGDRTKNCRKI